jgi:hypothetical protein
METKEDELTKERLELEKEKLELEKQKFEFEKGKSAPTNIQENKKVPKQSMTSALITGAVIFTVVGTPITWFIQFYSVPAAIIFSIIFLSGGLFVTWKINKE